MRRSLFLTLGLLEVVAAVIVVVLSFQLPTPAQVHKSSNDVHALTMRTSTQVQLLQNEIQNVRRPEVHALAKQVKHEIPKLTESLRQQQVSYEWLRSTRDGLEQITTGLELFSASLDPKAMQQTALSLGSMADYLDKKVVPQASTAAENLEKSTKEMAAQSRKLRELLRASAPDVMTAAQLRDSLKLYSVGLEKLNLTLDVDRLKSMRDGFAGIESSLTSASAQVSSLAGYTYPVVKLNGFRPPSVSQKMFWPKGNEIAKGMTKGATGLAAASKQMGQIVEDLPALKKSLEASQDSIEATHQRLARALERQEELDKVLKSAPKSAEALEASLLKLGGGLAKLLNDTADLKAMAVSLRASKESIEANVATWPALKKSLTASTTILSSAQSQLDLAIENEKRHKEALLQSLEKTETLAELLPVVTTQMDQQLALQSNSLDDLKTSLDQTGENVPTLAATGSAVLRTVRWLLWLFAGIIALHGAHLLQSSAFGLAAAPRSEH